MTHVTNINININISININININIRYVSLCTQQNAMTLKLQRA